MSEFESLKEIQQNTHGGARKGAGRKLHSKNPATIEREEAARQFKGRVAKNVHKLFNAQFSLATGTQMLFVIHTDSKGQRRKPEMVTDVEIISRFLDENEGQDGDMDMGYSDGSKASDYFFLTTAPPNNQALEGLLNRSFGKADQNIDLTTGGEKLNVALVEFVNSGNNKDSDKVS